MSSLSINLSQSSFKSTFKRTKSEKSQQIFAKLQNKFVIFVNQNKRVGFLLVATMLQKHLPQFVFILK